MYFKHATLLIMLISAPLPNDALNDRFIESGKRSNDMDFYI